MEAEGGKTASAFFVFVQDAGCAMSDEGCVDVFNAAIGGDYSCIIFNRLTGEAGTYKVIPTQC